MEMKRVRCDCEYDPDPRWRGGKLHQLKPGEFMLDEEIGEFLISSSTLGSFID